MPPILIVTRNIDKFTNCAALINKILGNAISIVNLNDTSIDFDVVEEGSIRERAEQKARMFWDYLKQHDISTDYLATIGIDDGFSLVENAEGDPQSKQLTDKILNGEIIKAEDTIWMKRGYAICNDSLGVRSCMTATPFVFTGNPKHIVRVEGTFPLSFVFRPVNHDRVIKDLPFDEAINYYFTYCQDELRHLLEGLPAQG